MTFAHMLSEARKFGLGLCVSHQTLSQLTERMIGALGNADTRMIFGVDRYDAEYLGKIVGRVDTEAIKREAKTENQHEVFSSTGEQWEQWYDRLCSQPPRHAVVRSGERPTASIVTLSVPTSYTASEADIEQVRRESLARYGVSVSEARRALARSSISNPGVSFSDPLAT